MPIISIIINYPILWACCQYCQRNRQYISKCMIVCACACLCVDGGIRLFLDIQVLLVYLKMLDQ